jgi:phage terminase large subunit GpA-like protein
MRSKINEIRAIVSGAIRPEPQLTISEWADRYRILSQVSAGEPGKWRTSRAPFMREIMDSMSPVGGFERVVFIKPSQIGGSECLLNLLGIIVHLCPGPTLMVQPTVELAARFSKQRVASLIQHTPELRGKISSTDTRNSDNTIATKAFAGGYLVMAGSNSAAGLRSMPARFIIMDEVDAYPVSAMGAAGAEGGSISEGDPCDLAIARSETFANRRIVMISTPTIKGISRIESAYEESDKRQYWLPCPHCGAFQLLKWSGVVWPEGKPEEAFYQCESCKGRIEDRHKPGMLDRGEWRAESKGDGRTAGFRINGLYSPWTTWAKLANAFVKASKSPERLRVFVNTVLAETWQDAGAEKIEIDALMSRREPFGAKLPAGVALLTAGVDVQADRLEVGIFGWGRDEEAWNIGYHIIRGDTTRPDVWRDLDKILVSEFQNDKGVKLPIMATCIDSGYATAAVYQFCRDRMRRRIYAIKGQAGRRPVWPRRVSKGKDKSPLFIVGTDACKDWIVAHLKIYAPGPGYIHFPMTIDRIFFEQLTSETIRIRYSKGFAIREWYKMPGARNEVLDFTCYAFAALQSLAMSGIRLNAYAEKMEAIQADAPAEDKPQQQSREGWPIRRKQSWLGDRTQNWLRR